MPIFPLLAETLFAPALLLGRASTANGVSLLATLATGAMLLGWGRTRLGRSSWALAPAAVWIGQPIVVYYAGSAYVEPLLMLFATAACAAFDRWRIEREAKWLALAGAFAGWGAATKYLGLYLIPLLALLAFLEAGRGARLLSTVRVAGAAAFAAGPWYALIWAFTDNPIFPLLPRVFGGRRSGAGGVGAAVTERFAISDVAVAGALPADGRRSRRPRRGVPWNGIVVARASRDRARLRFAARRAAPGRVPLACSRAAAGELGRGRPVVGAAATALSRRPVPERTPETGAFYALYGERLHYFGGERQLGEYSGPYRYGVVAPLLDRPRELARRLRGLGAASVLLPVAAVGEPVLEGLLASPDFRLAYRDQEAAVFAMVAPAATR